MGYGTVGLLRLDTAFAMGFVVETGLYCVNTQMLSILWAGFFLEAAYTCLFIAALPGMTNARRLKDAQRARSAWVFLIFSILMYVAATLHLTLSAFRFYKSIFLNVDPRGPVSYLKSWRHWEYLPLIVLFCVQTWLGDILVIYRCYFVWNSNLLLIFVPACLLLASIGINVVIWYWVYHPFYLTYKQLNRIFKWIYPLAFAQNLMTTGLIIAKIFLQHRISKKAGVVHVGPTHSLVRVIRIVIESAAIYTIQLFALIILYFYEDNGQYVVQAALTPSIGITFVLLAIRIQSPKATQNVPSPDLGITGTLTPQWPRNGESDADSGSSENDGGHSFSNAEVGGTDRLNKCTEAGS